jgi:hypothetical protein
LRLISNVCLFVCFVHKVIEFLYFIKVGYNLQDTIPTISDIFKKKIADSWPASIDDASARRLGWKMLNLTGKKTRLSICSKIVDE